MPQHTDVLLLGFGKIGRELAAQIAALTSAASVARSNRTVRVIAVIDKHGYVFDRAGLSPRSLRALIKHKTTGVSLAAAPGGVRAAAADALAHIATHALSRPILVDATAGDTAAVLQAAVAYGMDLVLANKRPLADSATSARELARSARAHGRRVLHEATVGAGLPVIDTIEKLIESGDRILKIEGCPSGTLGYLFGALGSGECFSSALRSAMKRGYTEPDPRDDLSGMDVARKALILGRVIGYSGELQDLAVESLVPEQLARIPLEEFLNRIEEAEAAWGERIAKANRRSEVLRYRTTVTKRKYQLASSVYLSKAHSGR